MATKASRVAVIGSGYVGTVVAACLAHVGHEVVGVESDPAKLAILHSGRAPFYEPGLDDLTEAGVRTGNLSFTDDFASAVTHSEVIFICVGTPSGPDGHPNMAAMQSVVDALATTADCPRVIVTKSTVPIGTGRWLITSIQEAMVDSGKRCNVSVVSNPEFLREGSAVEDFLHPDRVVLGGDSQTALDAVEAVYRPILEQRIFDGQPVRSPVPLIRTEIATAEMIKYASNAFLATKVSFANEVAQICDYVGADVVDVTAGMGLDSRIGNQFLGAGLGWGGSCFGKDLAALISTSNEYGFHPAIMEAAVRVNSQQRERVVSQLLVHLKTLRGVRLCILGLAFKPGTDDLRDAPGLDLVCRLVRQGAFVSVYDPMVTEIPPTPNVRLYDSAFAAAKDADAVIVATEWSEIIALDLAELRNRVDGPLFIDGRNCFDPAAVRAAGFDYVGIGRGRNVYAPRPRPHAAPRTLDALVAPLTTAGTEA
jgi:UDPglucose 6-dehydrogenase